MALNQCEVPAATPSSGSRKQADLLQPVGPDARLQIPEVQLSHQAQRRRKLSPRCLLGIWLGVFLIVIVIGEIYEVLLTSGHTDQQQQ